MDTERVLFEDGERRIVLINEEQICYEQLADGFWIGEPAYCDSWHPKSDGTFFELPGDLLVKILDDNRSASLPRCLEVLKGLAPDVAQSFADLLASPELAKRDDDGIDSKIDFIVTTCAQQFQSVGAEPEG